MFKVSQNVSYTMSMKKPQIVQICWVGKTISFILVIESSFPFFFRFIEFFFLIIFIHFSFNERIIAATQNFQGMSTKSEFMLILSIRCCVFQIHGHKLEDSSEEGGLWHVIKYRVSHSDFLHGFIASLSMIIVSELGDKTFFIAAIMAMRHSRIVVLSGALGALIAMTILSGE